MMHELPRVLFLLHESALNYTTVHVFRVSGKGRIKYGCMLWIHAMTMIYQHFIYTQSWLSCICTRLTYSRGLTAVEPNSEPIFYHDSSCSSNMFACFYPKLQSTPSYVHEIVLDFSSILVCPRWRHKVTTFNSTLPNDLIAEFSHLKHIFSS